MPRKKKAKKRPRVRGSDVEKNLRRRSSKGRKAQKRPNSIEEVAEDDDIKTPAHDCEEKFSANSMQGTSKSHSTNDYFRLLRDKNELKIFFEPTNAARHICGLLKNNLFVFIRAGVGCGKTMLARYLEYRFPKLFVLIAYPTLDQTGNFEPWEKKIVNAAKTNCNTRDIKEEAAIKNLDHALAYFEKNGISLIFDEGHLTFENDTLCTRLYKAQAACQKTPHILLLSATGSACYQGETVKVTPNTIKCKKMWRPTTPTTENILQEAKNAGILLDVKSIPFLVSLCASHLGILIDVLSWIKTEQQKQDSPQPWTAICTISKVRSGWEPGSDLFQKLSQNRAVKANGGYNLQNLPQEFLEILYTGPKRIGDATVRQQLTVRGMLLPLPALTHSNKEQEPDDVWQAKNYFTQANFDPDSVLFGVAHPVMGEYYRRTVAPSDRGEIVGTATVPDSCIDLLMRIVASLTFSNIITAPIPNLPTQSFSLSTAKGSSPSVLEIFFHSAIWHQLNRIKGISASFVGDSKCNRQSTGAPDLVVQHKKGGVWIWEFVRSNGEPNKHLLRFGKYAHYRLEGAKRCLITICQSAKLAGKQLKTLNDTKKRSQDLIDVQLIAIVPSPSYSNYTVITIDKNANLCPYIIPTDGAPRCLTGHALTLSLASTLRPSLKRELEKTKKELEKTKQKLEKAEKQYVRVKVCVACCVIVLLLCSVFYAGYLWREGEEAQIEHDPKEDL